MTTSYLVAVVIGLPLMFLNAPAGILIGMIVFMIMEIIQARKRRKK